MSRRSSSQQSLDERMREKMGFTTLLLIFKCASFLFMFGCTAYSLLIESATLHTLTILTSIEMALVAYAAYFSCYQRMRTFIFFLLFEISIAVVEMVFGLYIALKDKDFDCYRVPDKCATLHLTARERFNFVWLLVGKSTVQLFICLLMTAQSPLVHDYNRGWKAEKRGKDLQSQRSVDQMRREEEGLCSSNDNTVTTGIMVYTSRSSPVQMTPTE